MSKLDGVILNVELTLISIIQGVTLYFLVESSREILLEQRFVFWPYVAAGLIVLCLFWSRSIIHALTVIRWPMDFGHTFLYILAAFVQALAFTQVAKPANWFALNGVLASFILLLYIWDLRLIDSSRVRSPFAQVVLHQVRAEQIRNMRWLLPMTLLFNASACFAISHWPDFFLRRNGHLGFIALQLGAATLYLIDGILFFKRLIPHFEDSSDE